MLKAVAEGFSSRANQLSSLAKDYSCRLGCYCSSCAKGLGSRAKGLGSRAKGLGSRAKGLGSRAN